MTERLDIIVLGVTGFTGQHTLDVVHKMSKENGRNLTYGVAGRSEQKIKEILLKVGKRTGLNFENVPIIIADIKDEASLRAMAQKARVIINCCGPYRFLGEPVIKACIAEGTHHVDVSGEPQYMEEIQLKYHDIAEKSGVYIISACGFDSIPCDLGVRFLQNNFPGTLHSVESYMCMHEEGEHIPGPAVNLGTWESLIYSLAHSNEIGSLRSKLFPKRLPRLNPHLKLKKWPHRVPQISGWALPFPGADRSVMFRTQYHLYEKEGQRPVQVQAYFIVKQFWNIILLALMGSIFSLLTKFEFGRNLLLKYPKIFSLGIFDHQEPSEKKLEKTKFHIIFIGQGWREKLSDPFDQYSSNPDVQVVTRVEGSSPAYGATTICLVLAAVVTITETDALPSRGGVYTPGAAFGMTSLISQLDDNGVTFRIV